MRKFAGIGAIVLLSCILMGADGCDGSPGSNSGPKSVSGVREAVAEVKTGSDGLTAEQRNIKKRIEAENVPGKIQHLYVVSAYTGDCILYSTVQGKITSSGKRLSPYTVAALQGQYIGSEHNGIPIRIGGQTHHTGEVLQDDGTYGSSIEYLYWWDSRGQYHQHYVSGGQIIHVADTPMSWPKIILNLESVRAEK